MKRFDLLKSSDNRLWLINCTLRQDRLEAGLAVFFTGLPSSISVFSEESSVPITTVLIPHPEKVMTSAAEADMTFALAGTD